MAASSSLDKVETSRLQRARLRLAEAQGIVPIGSSEDPNFQNKDYNTIPSLSRVREIGWRVAEPSIQYNPEQLSSRFFSRPLVWLVRNVEFLLPFTGFTLSIIFDILMNEEKKRRKQRAEELLDIIRYGNPRHNLHPSSLSSNPNPYPKRYSAQSPALIKAGQALASRPDLLPKEYLDSLQKLQDRCPAYPTEEAKALLESELGMAFNDVFELDEGCAQPVAAASIGQVYKAKLRKNGAKVAIKIQRPNCEESIAIDMYIMRWYASIVQRVLKAVQRDINLVSVIDEFGEVRIISLPSHPFSLSLSHLLSPSLIR